MVLRNDRAWRSLRRTRGEDSKKTQVDGGRETVFLEGDPRRSSRWAGPGNKRYP